MSNTNLRSTLGRRAFPTLIVVAALGLAATAGAEDLTVCNDGGAMFIAVQDAVDAAVPGDAVVICESVHTEVEIVVDKELTIRGQGRSETVVQAGTSSSSAPGRVFAVEGGATVTFRSMTIQHGYAAADGGGVWVAPGSTARFLYCRVSNNTAAATGGGIAAGDGAELSLNGCEVRSNRAELGGGIAVAADALATLEHTEVASNRADAGGGILVDGGSMAVLDSTIIHNRAEGQPNGFGGGGILSISGVLEIDSSTISDNGIQDFHTGGFCGGGIDVVGGVATFVRSTFRENFVEAGGGPLGGAIANRGGSMMTIDSCTLNANRTRGREGRAQAGGIYNFESSLTLVNSTLSENLAFSEWEDAEASQGGGLLSAINSEEHELVVTHCTFFNNVARHPIAAGNGGGIFSYGPPPKISNTIIVGSFGSNCQFYPLEIAVTGAPNLSSDDSCPGFSIPMGNADLKPLACNGGSTDTHALGAASDALEAGDNTICAAAIVGGVDQRGVARPYGGSCDLGAVEIACPCLGMAPFFEMVQGEIASLACFDGEMTGLLADVGGSYLGAAAGTDKGEVACGFRWYPGSSMEMLPVIEEEAAACQALLRQSAQEQGLTCSEP